jgi:hypothetical protein
MNRSHLFAIAVGIALAMPVPLLGSGSASAADPAKGPNVDAAKRGSSPRTEAVAQAALADQVARHADRTRDVLAMIAAARMLSQTGLRAVKHDMRTEGTSKTADAKAGAATTRDTTLNGMLADPLVVDWLKDALMDKKPKDLDKAVFVHDRTGAGPYGKPLASLDDVYLGRRLEI